jgi:hypothetical protein
VERDGGNTIEGAAQEFTLRDWAKLPPIFLLGFEPGMFRTQIDASHITPSCAVDRADCITSVIVNKGVRIIDRVTLTEKVNKGVRIIDRVTVTEKPIPVPLFPPQIPHGLGLGLKPFLRSKLPATSALFVACPTPYSGFCFEY